MTIPYTCANKEQFEDFKTQLKKVGLLNNFKFQKEYGSKDGILCPKENVLPY